jgi:hypothetical protein
MRKLIILSLALSLFAAIATVHSSAQVDAGPRGTVVNYCVTATPTNGTFHLTNICSFPVQVVLDQPGGGTVEGMPVQPQSFTVQLLPKESANEGWTGRAHTVWACAGSNSPFSRATHKIPAYGDYNVYCPMDGNAGSAQ